jgi:hypothetical protein
VDRVDGEAKKMARKAKYSGGYDSKKGRGSRKKTAKWK